MNTLEQMPTERHTASNGNDMIQLPYGLPGFERIKNYVLLTRSEEEPFLWLQMEGEAEHAFLVTPPHAAIRHPLPVS
jgi:flagellar assembly factor FliW